jgi:hypothetical protein
MNSTSTRALILGLSLALVHGGCKEDQPVAVNPGMLSVNLTTPNNGLDGAAVVVLNGPAAPVSVTATSGLTLWGGPVTEPQSTIALTGVLNNGQILTIVVPDIGQASQYTASLREVAVNETVALRALTGYSLTVVP